MDSLHSIFIAEAKELIVDLERALLELEVDQENKDCISAVFRAMHTLKGSAGMFGFDSIGSLTHHLETIYADAREGRRRLTLDILNTTLKSVDHLKNLLGDATLNDANLRNAHTALIQQIEKLSEPGDEKNVTDEVSPVIDATRPCATYYVYFKPNPDVIKNGTNTLYMVDDVLSLGNGIALPFFENMPSLDELVPTQSYTGFEIIISTEKSESDIRDVFMFIEPDANLAIKELSKEDLLADLNVTETLLNEAVATSPIGVFAIESLLNDEIAPEVVVATELSKSRPASSVRVSSERLDEFMNLVSELVTTQASLSLYGNRTASAELMAIAENVEKITRRLRDNAFSMSLVPIESLVVRFQRLIRDLSKELNKDIVFKAEGTETEIDKAIVEKLTDPILHIMRNSLDHGIEMPAERLRKGKPAQGVVRLKSFYSGANVIIQISDDGAGINLEKVRKKAIARGLLDPDATPSEQELLNMIFLPGFSTAETVTGVSGRGVGMDVLRKNIADIQGEVNVSTVAGQGSTFTIRLPLTLSIIDGLLVKIGETDFILPLAAVDKCYEVETKKLEQTFSKRISLDGELIPFLYLRDDFEITTDAPDRSQVIKIAYEDVRISLVIDKIMGECQAVLKPLGHLYRNQDEFSGATILGDGSVALVIDPHKLSRKLIKSHAKKQLV